LLAALLVWALRAPKKREQAFGSAISLLDEMGRRHAIYLPLIHQALSPADVRFLASHGSAILARRVRKERRRVILAYLGALRDDFTRLLRFAKAVSVMAPEVATAQEAERAWLNAQFVLRYHTMRVFLHAGLLPQRGLDSLSHMVSELAVRMETVINELGERAA